MAVAWRKRCRSKLESGKIKRPAFSGCKNTAAFSVGVAIEFLLFSLLSLLFSYSDNYYVWYSMFLGFTVHLIGHCFMIFQYKCYVPGVVTSILFLPCSMYMLYIAKVILGLTLTDLLLCFLAGMIAMLFLIGILHRCRKLFEDRLEKFSQQV